MALFACARQPLCGPAAWAESSGSGVATHGGRVDGAGWCGLEADAWLAGASEMVAWWPCVRQLGLCKETGGTGGFMKHECTVARRGVSPGVATWTYRRQTEGHSRSRGAAAAAAAAAAAPCRWRRLPQTGCRGRRERAAARCPRGHVRRMALPRCAPRCSTRSRRARACRRRREWRPRGRARAR